MATYMIAAWGDLCYEPQASSGRDKFGIYVFDSNLDMIRNWEKRERERDRERGIMGS